LTDLYNYDYPLLEAAWPEGIAETLLNSSKNDEAAAEDLVRAYLEGDNECDEPLPTDYRDDYDNPETFEQEIRDDLKQEATRFIRSWREQLLVNLEQLKTRSMNERDQHPSQETGTV